MPEEVDPIQQMINESGGGGEDPKPVAPIPGQQQQQQQQQPQPPVSYADLPRQDLEPEPIDGDEPAPGEVDPITEAQQEKDKSGAPPEIDTKTVFGDEYETVDSVKDIMARGKAYTPEIEQELVTLRSKKSDLEQMEEKIKGFNPYKNPAFYKLDKLAEKDPDGVGVYQRLLFGKPEPLELVRLAAIKENPETFKDNEEGLDLHIEDLYPELYDTEMEEDDPKYKRAMIRLKVNAEKAKKMLMADLDAIEVPDPVQTGKEAAEAKTKLIDAWEPKLNEVKKDFVKVKVEVKKDDDSDELVHLMDIDVPDSDRENYLKIAADLVVKQGWEVTDKNIEQVRSYLTRMFIADNLALYNTKLADHLSTAEKGKWRSLVHNAERPKQKPPKQPDVAVQDQAESMLTEMRKDGQI